MKQCSKCVNFLPRDNFSKDNSKADGLYTVCKSCKKEYRKHYYAKTAARAKREASAWYYENRDFAKERGSKYYEKNIEEIKKRRKERYWRDPESAKLSVKEYNRERARRDPVFRMSCRCKKRIWAALNEGGYTKRSRSFDIIGCTPEYLAYHLEQQFSQGMTWSNYGDWHIDHKVPLASADTEDEVIRLCHYTNLQPLWAKENISKGARIDNS